MHLVSSFMVYRRCLICAGFYSSSNASVGPFTLTNDYTAGGRTDCFVAKLTSSGQVAWAQSYGGNRNDEAHGIAVLPSSGPPSIAITGLIESTSVTFGSVTLTHSGENYASDFKFHVNDCAVRSWYSHLVLLQPSYFIVI